MTARASRIVEERTEALLRSDIGAEYEAAEFGHIGRLASALSPLKQIGACIPAPKGWDRHQHAAPLWCRRRDVNRLTVRRDCETTYPKPRQVSIDAAPVSYGAVDANA